jgi:hypothetical protein
MDEGFVKLVNGAQLRLGDPIRPAEVERHHFFGRRLLQGPAGGGGE